MDSPNPTPEEFEAALIADFKWMKKYEPDEYKRMEEANKKEERRLREMEIWINAQIEKHKAARRSMH